MPNATLFLATIFFMFSCDLKKENKQAIDSNTKETQKTFVLGKKITGIEDILGDSIILSDRLILFYTGFDCGSCVKVGFDFVKEFDKQAINSRAIVIEIQSNKGRDQSLYSYYSYIYTDNHDLIRRRLKYVKTPIILYLDGEERINKIYQPQYDDVVTAESIRMFVETN